MVLCPYCNSNARLVTGAEIYPHRKDLGLKKFWLCRPCDAYVGCHPVGNGDGTKPLGRLANAELRGLKQDVHRVFDPLWQNGSQKRKDAYRYLADHLGIPYADCHVGMFDAELCRRAIEICRRAALSS